MKFVKKSVIYVILVMKHVKRHNKDTSGKVTSSAGQSDGRRAAANAPTTTTTTAILPAEGAAARTGGAALYHHHHPQLAAVFQPAAHQFATTVQQASVY